MDSTTLISLTTIIIGFISAFTMLCLKLVFKSKCSEVQCFCFKIKRDVRAEIRAEEMELGHNVNGSRITSDASNINLPI